MNAPLAATAKIAHAAARQVARRRSLPLLRASGALLLVSFPLRAPGNSAPHGASAGSCVDFSWRPPCAKNNPDSPEELERLKRTAYSNEPSAVPDQKLNSTIELVEHLLACSARVPRKAAFRQRRNWTARNIPMALPEVKLGHGPLVWIDCEMTGLDVKKDRIIEIAVVITDSDLNLLASGPELIITQPKDLLDGMNDWCKEQHGKSGLTADVLKSKLTTEEAALMVTSFVKHHIPRPLSGILAGNSVHIDKEFLRREMPELIEHLHHRIVDVSTVKELVMRWAPHIADAMPLKDGSHRALADIKGSIEELAYYRSKIFHLSNVVPLPAATGLGQSSR